MSSVDRLDENVLRFGLAATHGDGQIISPNPVAAAEADRIIAALGELLDSAAEPMIQEILEGACLEIAELAGQWNPDLEDDAA